MSERTINDGVILELEDRTMDYRFSVLLPVYNKEMPEYFSEALASVINQTLKPNEIVVVKDGPLTEELEEVLSKYEIENPELFKIVRLPQREGCGGALAVGVKECSYELVARMDSDDISRKDRFEKQIYEFKNNPYLSICGSQIAEFETNINRIVSYRRVPISDAEIKKYQRLRSAFNHMTVMFKKSIVLECGNYQNYPNMEDYVLWSKVLHKDETLVTNIAESLVFVRIGMEMFNRRGGLEYYKTIKQGRKLVYESGEISGMTYYLSLPVHFLVAITPNRLRAFIYKHFLRH